MGTSVNITDRAASRILDLSAKSPDSPCLRISVNGGGCSGFQYDFSLVSQANADDVVVERGGAKVLIDPLSLQYMAGATVDFVDDLMGQSFKVQNPLAKASCGCGTSFTI